MNKFTELKEKLKALEVMFAQRLPMRLREIDAALEQCAAEPANPAHAILLHRLLHSIAGTAGTFGYARLGERASSLEHDLAPFLEGGAAAQQALPALLPALREFSTWAAGAPSDAEAGEIPIQLPEPIPDPDAELSVLLVGGDPAAANDLMGQLQVFGFLLVQIPKLEDLAQRMQQQPCAVILFLDFYEGVLAGADRIGQIRALAKAHVPAIVLSADGSFEARLAAVRAGADGYFSLPADVVALSHRLDALTARAGDLPFRIMTVDDDEVSAEYHATILRSAGMEVKALTRPSAILSVLGEFRPELILMDVYMPNSSGIELAHMVRQDNAYLDVPIVFLSSEHNQAKQLAAIESGADDFLVKPIDAAHLVSAVSHRAKRYRALRGLIMRDSLTGLYNHSAIKEHLMREVSRAQRSRLPLSLAVIDLDFFKRVNDTYGHMVGDQVLRALARLLQQWMRRSDIVGRYGGEEFVVLLPGTSAEDSISVLDNVREAFAKVRYSAGEKDFNVTFSVGVADLAGGGDADTLFKAADDALYRAKGAGRNRVEKAEAQTATSI